jgi:fatty-acyl-CoA synthase
LGLTIPCLNAVGDLADAAAFEKTCSELLFCVETAARLNIPYVRLRAADRSGGEDAAVSACIERLLHELKSAGHPVAGNLRAYPTPPPSRSPNRFASDSLAALWDFHHPFRYYGESAETTVTNLGAYIKHVHIKDSVNINGKIAYRLVGEGDLPLSEMMDALRSVGYDGFVSLELDPKTIEGLGVPEIVFPHYVHRMERYDREGRRNVRLYDNKAGTGKFDGKRTF